MSKNRSLGFTLIELLVVVAIIGILSAVVLASLSTARNKASDAKIQSQLSSMRAAAEIYYGSTGNGSYGTNTSCTGGIFNDSGSGMQGLITAINASNMTCNSNGTAWAARSTLQSNAGNGNAWCVDSTGASKSVTSALTTPQCP